MSNAGFSVRPYRHPKGERARMYEQLTRYLDPPEPGERRFGHWIDELTESGLADRGYWETCCF